MTQVRAVRCHLAAWREGVCPFEKKRGQVPLQLQGREMREEMGGEGPDPPGSPGPGIPRCIQPVSARTSGCGALTHAYCTVCVCH